MYLAATHRKLDTYNGLLSVSGNWKSRGRKSSGLVSDVKFHAALSCISLSCYWLHPYVGSHVHKKTVSHL